MLDFIMVDVFEFVVENFLFYFGDFDFFFYVVMCVGVLVVLGYFVIECLVFFGIY